MKKIILLCLCISNIVSAQDSIKKSGFKYKKLILPASLITVGTVLKLPTIQQNLQDDVNKLFGKGFCDKSDDYFQFVPVAQLFAGNYLGFKSKNNNKQMLTNTLVSNLMVMSVVTIGKNASKDMRPDGSAENSFPSGHSATAFNNATLLFYQYKDSNIWYASSGYLFATTTALFRVANRRHWAGDVVVGAGVGIAIGTIVNYWNPFDFDKKKQNKTAYPIIGQNSYGIGAVWQLTN